jgi:hypothetical protein
MAQSLGGHKSKKHPGQSLDYKEKLLKRKLREKDRVLLKKAKLIYYTEYGPYGFLNRSLLRQIKD